MCNWRRLVVITAIAACVAPSVGNAGQTGRWKLGGDGSCYWDPNDSGPNQCDPNQPSGAVLFDKILYDGASMSVGGDLSFVGWDWNDRVSSVRVPAGATITLYEHSDFGGAYLTLTSDAPDLRNFAGPGPGGTWNDAVSSIRFGAPNPPPPTSSTILVNGSFNEAPEWAQPGSAEYNAIAAAYGVSPYPWPWTANSLTEVIPPYYTGIINGGFALANYLASLPPGDVNLISHSHGGNVVLMSQAWSTRPIRRYIQLGTPINWDFGQWRYALNYDVEGRCQASSTADWKQFFGSSPYQVGNFFYSAYHSVAGAIQAFESLRNGDYEGSFYWFATSVFDAIQADSWLDTTRIEVEGPTYVFSGLSHADLHEPPVWNAIAPYCR
jgi:hypothetical protein